jgi:hypothetical protein
MYCKIFPSLGQSIFYYHNPLWSIYIHVGGQL